MENKSQNKNIQIVIKNNEAKIKEGKHYQNKNFCIIANQTPYDSNQKEISLKKIIELYENKIEPANIISNTFSIIILDKRKKQITCIQDINGDSIPIYIYKHNEEFMITNKIINIINNYKDNFCINPKAISNFIKKGFIPNKETLVKNIYKLIPKHNLIINLQNQKMKFIKKKIKYEKIKNYTTDIYINEFKKIIQNNEKDKKVYITLSSGYDSNFIFRFLDKNKPIEAFSIGGITGTDETEKVADNIKKYNNTHLHISYVDEKTLEEYPNLIYNLEGALYERGIFLQYELYKNISKMQLENVNIFAGEGADQIFSYEYYNEKYYYIRCIKYITKKLKKIFKNHTSSKTNGGIVNRFNRYQFLTYIIIKKNGILMNNLNINTVYPYLYKNIINIGHCNRYKNMQNKNSHIQACNKEIDSNILKNIEKIGGATDPIALFKNYSNIQEIEDLVSKSKYNIVKMNKDINSNKYLNHLLKVLYIEIFEYLFIEHPSNIEDKKNLPLSQIIQEKNKENIKHKKGEEIYV